MLASAIFGSISLGLRLTHQADALIPLHSTLWFSRGHWLGLTARSKVGRWLHKASMAWNNRKAGHRSNGTGSARRSQKGPTALARRWWIFQLLVFGLGSCVWPQVTEKKRHERARSWKANGSIYTGGDGSFTASAPWMTLPSSDLWKLCWWCWWCVCVCVCVCWEKSLHVKNSQRGGAKPNDGTTRAKPGDTSCGSNASHVSWLQLSLYYLHCKILR